MNEKEFELVFIIDRSGSMGGLENDIIGGFNSLTDKQRSLPLDTYVTVVLFDHEVEMIRDHVPIKEVKPLTDRDYCVRGSTALLDAVGMTVERITRLHESLGDKAPAKTMYVIMTDGYENASRMYSNKQVRELIGKVQEGGAEVMFTGAGIDAFAEGGNLGIRKDMVCECDHDSQGIDNAMNEVFYSCCSYTSLPLDAWKDYLARPDRKKAVDREGKDEKS